MKIELEINADIVEEVIHTTLREHIDMVENHKFTHPDDIKYYNNLLPALKLVYEYYGGA